MTEELVTLETAKLLKEKGFNERTLFAYKNNGNLYQDFNRIRLSYNSLPVPELCENFCACESDNPCYKMWYSRIFNVCTKSIICPKVAARNQEAAR